MPRARMVQGEIPSLFGQILRGLEVNGITIDLGLKLEIDPNRSFEISRGHGIRARNGATQIERPLTPASIEGIVEFLSASPEPTVSFIVDGEYVVVVDIQGVQRILASRGSPKRKVRSILSRGNIVEGIDADLFISMDMNQVDWEDFLNDWEGFLEDQGIGPLSPLTLQEEFFSRTQ